MPRCAQDAVTKIRLRTTIAPIIILVFLIVRSPLDKGLASQAVIPPLFYKTPGEEKSGAAWRIFSKM
jgi:hypothetical protein